MMRFIKKWLQYRRILSYHADWAGFFVFSQNWRKAHFECEKMRRVKAIWRGKPYHFCPYADMVRICYPELHAVKLRLNIPLD